MKQKRPASMLIICALCLVPFPAHADSLSQQMVSANDVTRETAFQQLDSLSEADRKSAVSNLISYLSDSDLDKRERALEAISKIGPGAKAAIPALQKSLNDDLPYIREHAAEALTKMGSAALPVFLQELNSENSDLRATAASSIGKLDPAESKSAIPALVRALSDGDSAVREKSETALEGMGPDIASSILTQIDKATGESKLTMIHLLGVANSTNADVIQKLIGFLNSDNRQTHLTAVKALDHKGSAAVPELIDALRSDDAALKVGAGEVLADMGPKGAGAIPALVTNLKDPQAVVRMQSAIAIGKMGSEAAAQAIPALEEAKKDPDPRVAAKAADALTNVSATIQKKETPSLFSHQNNEETSPPAATVPLKTPSAKNSKNKRRPARVTVKTPTGKSRLSVVALIKQLQNPDQAKRTAASQALVQMNAKAVPALIQAMENPDAAARVSICSILMDITPPAASAVPMLSRALQDPAPEVRQNAAAALTKIDKVAAVSALIEAAQAIDVAISTQAIATLGLMGADAKDAVPVLTGLTKSENPDVRASASEALGQIGTPEARKAVEAYNKQQTFKAVAATLKDLRKDPKTVDRPAVEALIKIGAPAVSQVMLALKDPHPAVREGAAKALNGIGRDSGAAVPTLIEALDDSDAIVRHESAAALEKIGTPAATKPLGMYRLKEKFRDALRALHLS